MRHRLDPLLRPGSIAVVGATQRDGAVGKQILTNLTRGGFAGRLSAVNPNYDAVADVPCYPSLGALPDPAEHVMFAVRDDRMEAALAEAIEHGAAAVTIMSSLVLEQDAEPRLRERVAQQARDAGLLVCGGNGMGFYNFVDHVWACGFATRAHEPGGNVALISHSGSGMSGIVDVDERIHFNLAVSTGQELTVAMDDYLDFALELPGTRVVGLFMETVRNPVGIRAALEKANRKGIPVVALKVGRTELAARLTVSHSGALAGRDASYDALFDRYRAGTDFIQQYIFPGGMLPSPAAFRREARRSGLAVVNEHAFGHDYARTLATWRERFHAQVGAVRALGFDDRFVRIWDFYLAYCEAAVARRSTDVVQFTLARA